MMEFVDNLSYDELMKVRQELLGIMRGNAIGYPEDGYARKLLNLPADLIMHSP
jgi:hypothetical protein